MFISSSSVCIFLLEHAFVTVLCEVNGNLSAYSSRSSDHEGDLLGGFHLLDSYSMRRRVAVVGAAQCRRVKKKKKKETTDWGSFMLYFAESRLYDECCSVSGTYPMDVESNRRPEVSMTPAWDFGKDDCLEEGHHVRFLKF